MQASAGDYPCFKSSLVGLVFFGYFYYFFYFITGVFLTTLQHLFSKKNNRIQYVTRKEKIKKYYSTVCTYELETVGVLIQ